MKQSQLIIYSIIGLVLFGFVVYMAMTDSDPGPPPKVETDLPDKAGNPAELNDPEGLEKKQADLEGDEQQIIYSFSSNVQPIMRTHCFSCHSKKEEVGEELYFYDYDSVLKLTKAGDLMSPIPASITINGSMRKYLTDEQAQIIRAWVLEGAKP